MPLATVRRSRDLTQAEVAARLGVDQAQVSRLDRRQEMRLSTIVDYLASLGGKEIELAVTFDDGERISLPVGRVVR